MSKVSLAGISVLGALSVALLLGTMWLGEDPNGATVVTVLGMLGIGISQLLGNKQAENANKQAEEAAKITEELSKDLRNGTFERLLREALTKLAKENGFPLEVGDKSREEGDGNG
jgi:hypothetical protein